MRSALPRLDPAAACGFVVKRAFEESGGSQWVLQRGAEIARVNVRGNLSFSTGEALVEAALAGDGSIGIFDFIAGHALRSRQLVRRLDDWTPPHRG